MLCPYITVPSLIMWLGWMSPQGTHVGPLLC